MKHWKLAHQAGLKAVAKVAVNNTWELSSVPYLPVMDHVAQHCAGLAKQDIDGLMLSWSLGGYPSPNLKVAQRFAEQPSASVDKVLDDLAHELYGTKGAPYARRAWTELSQAFAEYPYNGQVVYNAPQQVGPANLLHAQPTKYTATMVGFPYDDLDGWRGSYPRDVFVGQMRKVATGWEQGVATLRRAAHAAPPDRRAFAASDVRVAAAAQLHFASVANQAQFVSLRDTIAAAGLDSATAVDSKHEILQVLDDEIRLATQLFAICRADSRIGFEASNHYYYTPLDLIEKVINCEFLRSEFDHD